MIRIALAIIVLATIVQDAVHGAFYHGPKKSWQNNAKLVTHFGVSETRRGVGDKGKSGTTRVEQMIQRQTKSSLFYTMTPIDETAKESPMIKERTPNQGGGKEGVESAGSGSQIGQVTSVSDGTNTNDSNQHHLPQFPLDMVVDQSLLKQSLLLAAVNPRINGVVIYGGRGTGKSVLARSIHQLLPPTIEVIKGSQYNVDPKGELGVDSILQNELLTSAKFNGTMITALAQKETEHVPCPIVEIPLNVMEDSLVGTVDIERSIEAGRTIFNPGLLAKAHRGVLYVDDINLLDEEAANLLLNVVADGFVAVEREGLSVRYPCRPSIVLATYNPDEGELREHLLDRIGVALPSDATPLTIRERVQVVDNVVMFTSGTERQLAEGTKEREDQVMDAVVAAREKLGQVQLTSSQIRYLCEEAIRADCEGHRAEIFAAEVAKASAALAGRTRVTSEDLRRGVLLAIAPRGAYTLEEQASESTSEDTLTPEAPPPPYLQQQADDQNDTEDSEEEEETEEDQAEEDDELDDEDVEEESEDQSDEPLEIPEEFMFGVQETPVDPKLMAFARWTKRGKGGKSARIFNLERGRFVKPIFPKGSEGKIAVGATLRAAAPYQKARRRRAVGTKDERRLVFITKDDFRIKRMARKAGTLIIFAVDASGSMALNRMNAAKGAAISLLAESYKHRDKICLIAFRDAEAEVLVPPTRSMALTKSRLEGMPCGGGSPLSHALLTAMRTGLNAMKIKKDVGKVVVVCITDGRANIPMCTSLGEEFNARADPESKDGMPSRKFLHDEVMVCAKRLGALQDFNFLCIDTEDKFVGTGLARELATVAQGNYHHLGKADTKEVTHVTKKSLEAARKGAMVTDT